MRGDGSLEGWRILLTRTPKDNARIRSLLEERGAVVIELPVVSISPPEDWGALDEALAHLDRYDWIAFSSRNAVLAVLDRLESLGKPVSVLRSTKVAAVGPATAAELAARDVFVSCEPAKPTGTDLADAIRAEGVDELRILVPKGNLGSPDLRAGLENGGARVESVVVYQTLPPLSVDASVVSAIRNGEVDVVALASPSAIRNLVDLLGTETSPIKNVQFACIGPTTAAEVESLGLKAAAVAEEPTAEGLVRAIADLANETSQLAGRTPVERLQGEETDFESL